MIRAVLSLSLLLLLVVVLVVGSPANEGEPSRLAGLYIKDGNENGQLRFLAGGLNSNSNSELDAAINQYIDNEQDALEQLRPVNSNSGTDLSSLGLGSLVSGAGTDGLFTSGTDNGGISSTSNGAIYVSLNGNGAAANTVDSSSNQAVLSQLIYGSSPIANLLPSIVSNAVAARRRPSVLRGVNNRRRPGQRRRPGKKGKRGKKPQVVIVRPNRG